MDEQKQPIDLNPLSLACLHPNPTVIITTGRHLWIKVHSLLYVETHWEGEEGDQKPILLLKFMDGKLLDLNPAESREFMEKVSLIAAEVHKQMEEQKALQQAQYDAMQRAAAAQAAQRLGIKSH